jgi:hypothetical protein
LRNPLEDTPDWRYGVALAELDREQGGLPVYEPDDDVYVRKLKQFLPLRTVRSRFIDPAQRLGSETVCGMELIVRIYEDQAVCGLRDIMEAALLAEDVDIEFFQTYVSRNLIPDLVDTYRDLFYDIDDKRDMQLWVQRNLFVPNRHLSGEKFRSAYMWKVVAYHGGIESFLRYAVDGAPMTEELQLWFRTMGVSEYVRQVLKSSHTYAKLLDSAGTPALPQAGNWQQKTDRDGGPSDDTAGAADALAEAIAVKATVEEVATEREYIDDQKFSNEDNA